MRPVRQALEPRAKRPLGSPIALAHVQSILQSVFNIGLRNVIGDARPGVLQHRRRAQQRVDDAAEVSASLFAAREQSWLGWLAAT